MRKITRMGMCALGLLITPIAYASQELDTVYVTAIRESSSIHTPEMKVTVTKGDMEKIGAKTVYDALRGIPGLHFQSFGAGGVDYDNHATQVNARGIDHGAEILVDGVPLSTNGQFLLSSIDLNAIDHIDVTMGSASVLYGENAMGGVINIVTKPSNTPFSSGIKGTWGNHGNHGFHFHTRGVGFGLSYSKDLIGPMTPTTPTTLSGRPGQPRVLGYGHRNPSHRENIEVNAKLSPYLDVRYGRSHTDFVWGKTAVSGMEAFQKAQSYDGQWDVMMNTAAVMYHNKGSQGQIYYSDRTRHYTSVYGDGRVVASGTNYRTKRYGLDYRTTWMSREENDQCVAGFSLNRETYRGISQGRRGNESDRGNRNEWAPFLQYTHHVNDRYTQTWGLRYQVAKDTVKDYHVWIPQFQQLYRLTPQWSLYSNVGKTFRLPRLSDYFHSIADERLRPEQGWNYEVGANWENIHDRVKLAFYHVEIKDEIQSVLIDHSHDWLVKNVGRFRNTGVELAWTHQYSDTLTHRIGISYSNPKEQETPNSPWVRSMPKWQWTSDLFWTKGKWAMSLSFINIGDRAYHIPNFMEWGAKLHYHINDRSSIAIIGSNLGNRRNITRDSDILQYYSDPRSWRIEYQARW